MKTAVLLLCFIGILSENFSQKSMLKVLEVYNGCEFSAETEDGFSRDFRLLGLDCPSSETDDLIQKYHANESRKLLEEKIGDREVYVEYDLNIIAEEGYELIYAYTNDDIFLNADLLARGHVKVLETLSEHYYTDYFSEKESQAKQYEHGLWNKNFDYEAYESTAKEKEIEESAEVFKIVQQMPRFPGCENAFDSDKEIEKCAKQLMLEFIYDNLQYPPQAKSHRVEGMAVLRFIINERGDVRDIDLLRDPGYGCGEEALRIVKSMNDMSLKWIPGRQRGKPVKVLYTLPVKFGLDKD